MSMTSPPEYSPPTSAAIRAKQDEIDALRLLIAQRKLYSRAKRWLGVRWFGMVIIGTAAPVVSVLAPDLAVWAGAIAGLWIFIGRTVLLFMQSATAAKAAATQEQFDFYVYGMPSSIDRSSLPSLEDIARIAGPDDEIVRVARQGNLLGWYPIRDSDTGTVSVAISQRANASYADQLLRATAITWGVLVVLWTVILVVASVVTGISLLMFIAGVLLPLLPAFLDIGQYVVGIWRAARDRGDLARKIEERIREAGEGIEPSELLVWQEHLYELRRSTPEVPDFIYKIHRKANERAMHSAAQQLGDQSWRSQ